MFDRRELGAVGRGCRESERSPRRVRRRLIDSAETPCRRAASATVISWASTASTTRIRSSRSLYRTYVRLSQAAGKDAICQRRNKSGTTAGLACRMQGAPHCPARPGSAKEPVTGGRPKCHDERETPRPVAGGGAPSFSRRRNSRTSGSSAPIGTARVGAFRWFRRGLVAAITAPRFGALIHRYRGHDQGDDGIGPPPADPGVEHQTE